MDRRAKGWKGAKGIRPPSSTSKGRLGVPLERGGVALFKGGLKHLQRGKAEPGCGLQHFARDAPSMGVRKSRVLLASCREKSEEGTGWCPQPKSMPHSLASRPSLSARLDRLLTLQAFHGFRV